MLDPTAQAVELGFAADQRRVAVRPGSPHHTKCYGASDTVLDRLTPQNAACAGLSCVRNDIDVIVTGGWHPPCMTVRSLHLVDLENLAGDPRASERDALAAYVDYLRAADWRADDVVYLAVNPGLAERIGWASVVPCRLHCARGTDGADLALLAHAAPEFVARRFERLVVGSGDHIFVPRAMAARDLGVEVTVVSRPASLSHEWHRAGFTVRELPSRDLVAA